MFVLVFVLFFFIFVGLCVDFLLFGCGDVVLFVFVVIVCVIVGKLVIGFVVCDFNVNCWVVGFGMVFCGEVGLIFVVVGVNFIIGCEFVVLFTIFIVFVVMVVVMFLVVLIGFGFIVYINCLCFLW